MSQALLDFSGSRMSSSTRISFSKDQDDWDDMTWISLNTARDWGDIKAGKDLFSSDPKLKEYKNNLIKVIHCFTCLSGKLVHLTAGVSGGRAPRGK